MKRKIACIFTSCLLAVCAALPVSAATTDGTGFVQSIEQHAAPEVQNEGTQVTIELHDGKQTVGAIDLANYGYHLVLTPYSEIDTAPNQTIKDDLHAAADELSASESSADITFKDDANATEFADAQNAAEEKGKKLVCTNLFDLSLVKDIDGEKVACGPLTVTLAAEEVGDLQVVMHRPDNTWELVPFTDNGDGTVTFTLTSLCPIAFFVEADASVVIPDIPAEADSSKTDDSKSDDSSKTDDSKSDSKTDSSSTDSKSSSSSKAASSSTTSSPDTGAVGGAAFAVPAVIAVFGAVVLAKKSRKD